MSMFFGLYRAIADKPASVTNRISEDTVITHFWVNAESPEAAEALCVAYMQKHGLSPTVREGVWSSRDLPMQNLGTGAVQLLRRAEQYGIAMDILAVSSDDPPMYGLRPWKS